MTNTEHTNGNLTVHFKVKDFNAWRTSYDANAKDRASAGITNSKVFRNADDPNDVVVLQDVADVGKGPHQIGLRRPEGSDAKERRNRLTEHPLRGLSSRGTKL